MTYAQYRVLKAVETNPELSQRELAEQLGISLGKTNYCIRALLDKGWVKASNFRNSHNKRAYMYQLTPKGIDGKARLAMNFLRHKSAEFDALKKELAELLNDVNRLNGAD